MSSFRLHQSTIFPLRHFNRKHALVFNLNAPPSYEKEQVSGKRLKLSYLPIPAHERAAPFTLMIIRIVCVSQKDIQQFRDLCSIAHLNKVDDYDYPVDHRDLFGVADMITMCPPLSPSWIVAFQWNHCFETWPLILSKHIVSDGFEGG